MPFHIDYRPQSLDEFVGNRATVQSLRSVLDREKDIPHSLLFTGFSGCGKTTLGRIVANKLGCHPHDLREVDSADFRGIDTIRDIRNQARLKPMAGPVRVWILDECHKMTNDAQNALLKILEDTPPHVYFILCTTDPNKLLKTIRSRCMPFTVGPLTEKQTTNLLSRIVEAEGVEEFPEEAYHQIYQNSLGHVRAAVVLLDKVIDLQPRLILKAIEKAKGEEASTIDLCRALLKRDKWTKIAGLLRGLQDQEEESVRRAVMGYMHNVLIKDNGPVITKKQEMVLTQAFLVMEAFQEPFYNTGKPGLTFACYEAVKT